MTGVRDIKDKNIRRRGLTAFAVGAVIGAVLFILFYGVKIIAPGSDSWTLRDGGDLTQHQLGWMYYRKSPWQFPIGLISGITSADSVSCVYTDCIPLLAVPCKLLSPILPQHFQYFGLWDMLCFVLQGGVAALLVSELGGGLVLSAAGSVLYNTFPPMIERSLHHDAFLGQWVILLGILMWVRQLREKKRFLRPVIGWTVLGLLAAAIHPYFIPMVYLLLLGYCLTDVLKYRKVLRPAVSAVCTTLAIVLELWVLGAFYGSGEYSEKGLGVYSANLNAFFNPFVRSKFLKSMNHFDGQYEGLGYLGLGMLLLCFLSAVLLVNCAEKHGRREVLAALNRHRAELIAAAAVMIVCMFFAASPRATLNRRVLWEISYPERITEILSIFRCSGRFIWVADQMIYTGVFLIVSRLGSRKTAAAVTAACAAVQLLDFRDWIAEKRAVSTATVEYTYKDNLKDEKWEELFSSADELIFTPLPSNFLAYRDMYFTFEEAVYGYDIDLSSFNMARVDRDSLMSYAEEELDRLESGSPREGVLYVFFSEEQAPQDNDIIDVYTLDGYTVAAAAG